MSHSVLIADDEPHARQRLIRLLDANEKFHCVAEAANGSEVLDFLKENHADVVLLDIQMPGMDGLATAAAIQLLHNPPLIIFCTAYDDHAIQAFRVNAMDYLLKPASQSEVNAALDRAAQRLTNQSKVDSKRLFFNVQTHKGLERIPLTNVIACEADLKFVTLYHDHGEALLSESLKQIEEKFGDFFIRIHRSTLVAFNRIESLDTQLATIKLRGMEKTFAVSRRHLSAVKEALKNNG